MEKNKNLGLMINNQEANDNIAVYNKNKKEKDDQILNRTPSVPKVNFTNKKEKNKGGAGRRV